MINDEIYNIYRRNVLLIESDQADGKSYYADLSDEEFEKFRLKLGRAKLWLYKQNDFLPFAEILNGLRTVPCREIGGQPLPTMAVDKLDNIFINPEFLEKLPLGEVIGVLAHEAFHHLNLTFPRQNGRDMKRWNIATDYIMNRDLIRDGLSLPSLGLIPTQKNGRYYITDGGLNLDITEMTSEQLYDYLENNLPPPQEPPPNTPTNPQPPQPKQPKQKKQIKVGDPVVDKKNNIFGIVKSIDPLTNKATIEPKTKQEIKDYEKNRNKGGAI